MQVLQHGKQVEEEQQGTFFLKSKQTSIAEQY
jgi:hypothetical protein